MTMFPPYFNLFDHFLGDERLAETGRRSAINFRGGVITYEELRQEVNYWTEQLIACGVSEGDRVALLLYDSPEFVALFLATVSIGAVAVPINTFLPPEDVLFIISDSGAGIIISEDELEWKIDLNRSRLSDACATLIIDSAARQYLEPKDDIAPRPPLPATTRESPAFLLYTSGSTGAPKGVLHRHESIPCTVDTYARSVLALTERDRVYSASRLFFAYGLGNSLSFPLSAGATVILDTERPTADHLAKLFEEQEPSVFFGVPAVYRALLERHAGGKRLNVSSIRTCVSAGEALPAKIFDDWKGEFGLEILDGIGSTEMLHIFISNRKGDARAGSSGQVVEGYEAKLVDEDWNQIDSNQPGNLWVRGKSATSGYWNRADLTREAVREGWVRTGDIYRRDGEGYFYHIGRSDDCFKVKGLWVSPIEVEAALLAHESVSDAAVVSGVDENGLATVRAYVVIRPDREREALHAELREFVGSRLPQHKVPSQINFIDELPRTSTGKVQRFKLRAGSRANQPGGLDER